MEAPYTSFCEWMFDCFSFVMQRPKRWGKHLVSIRHSVFVFVLLLIFFALRVSTRASWSYLDFWCYNDEVCARTCFLQGLAWLWPWAPKLCAFLCATQMARLSHKHYARTHCQAFQVDHIWSCLVLLVFSFPQALFYMHTQALSWPRICAHIGTIMPFQRHT